MPITGVLSIQREGGTLALVAVTVKPHAITSTIRNWKEITVECNWLLHHYFFKISSARVQGDLKSKTKEHCADRTPFLWNMNITVTSYEYLSNAWHGTWTNYKSNLLPPCHYSGHHLFYNYNHKFALVVENILFRETHNVWHVLLPRSPTPRRTSCAVCIQVYKAAMDIESSNVTACCKYQRWNQGLKTLRCLSSSW